MKTGDYVAGGLALGVVALTLSQRRASASKSPAPPAPSSRPPPLQKKTGQRSVGAENPDETPAHYTYQVGSVVDANVARIGRRGAGMTSVKVVSNTPSVVGDYEVVAADCPFPDAWCSREWIDQEDIAGEASVPAPSTGVLLDAATGLLFEEHVNGYRPATPPAQRTPWEKVDVRRPHNVADYVSAAFLTGEEWPGAHRAAIEREVQDAFALMNAYYTNVWYPAHLGASRPDIPNTLRNVSQYRSFADQAAITASVLKALGVSRTRFQLPSSDTSVRRALLASLTTRSVPGFSRHHWGTEIDAVSPYANAWKPGAQFAPLVAFMANEAPRFGFYNSFREGAFPEPARPHYDSEPWHLSYFPIAARLRERWLTEVNVPALLERAAQSLASLTGAGLATLRRVLPTLDLASYQRNVVPVPVLESRHYDAAVPASAGTSGRYYDVPSAAQKRHAAELRQRAFPPPPGHFWSRFR